VFDFVFDCQAGSSGEIKTTLHKSFRLTRTGQGAGSYAGTSIRGITLSKDGQYCLVTGHDRIIRSFPSLHGLNILPLSLLHLRPPNSLRRL